MAQNGENQLVQVEERDNLGNTPLHYAIERGDKDSIKLLLRNGVNANSANKKGYTPLHYICKRERVDGLAEIFFECNDEINQSVQIDAQNKLGKSPLHLALYKRNTNVAELLLRRGADPNLPDTQGLTPLHIMCNSHRLNYDWMKIFFEICEERNQQVQVDAVDNLGRTPLYLAILHGYKTEMIELLVRNGANFLNVW